MLRRTATGIQVTVRVVPRASRNEITASAEALRVRLTAPPVGGAANDALVSLLADRLGVPRRSVRLVAGGHGRRKQVAIDGVSLEAVEALLGSASRGHRI